MVDLLEIQEKPFDFTTAVLVVGITIYVLRWAVQHKRYIDACNKLPGYPMGSWDPWLCDVKQYIDSVDTVPGYPGIPRSFCVIYKYHQEYAHEGLYRIWMFNPYRLPFMAKCAVTLIDPQLVRKVLTDKEITKRIVREKQTVHVVKPLLGESFLMLPDGTQWKHQRKLATLAFDQDFLEFSNKVIIQLLYGKVFASLDRKLDDAEKAQPSTAEDAFVTMDISEWCGPITAEVLGLVAFSYSFGGLEEDNKNGAKKNENSLIAIYNELTCILSKRSYTPQLVTAFQWRENRRFDVKRRQLDAMVDAIIQERLAEYEKNKRARKATGGPASPGVKKDRDLLSYMLQEDDTDEDEVTNKTDRLTYKELRDNTKMFMFAGQDTTGNSLKVALWELGTHVEAQEKLRAEVDTLFDGFPKGQYPDYKNIMNLKYLDAVVKETLRMYAPGVVTRTSTDDITLTTASGNQYTIPKETSIFIIPCAFQRQVQVFPDRPGEWIPERFLQDNSTGGSNCDGWMPFSVGPRNCVGQPLAMAELKIVLAHLIRNYSFGKSEKMEDEPILLLLVNIRPHQVLLDVRRRRN